MPKKCSSTNYNQIKCKKCFITDLKLGASRKQLNYLFHLLSYHELVILFDGLFDMHRVLISVNNVEN